MKKQKIEISRDLRTTSPNIIWKLIGTPEGMARWIADEVSKEGDALTFTWGNTWGHHEIKKATVTQMEKHRHIRFRWENEDDDEAYVEMRMEKSPLTNEYMLHITDYAYPEDEDGLHDIWCDNMEKLHRSSGL